MRFAFITTMQAEHGQPTRRLLERDSFPTETRWPRWAGFGDALATSVP